MSRHVEIVVRRIVEVRSEMLEAIRANDVNQYDADIRVMRHTIDELLDCQPEDGEPPAGRTVRPEDCVVVKKRTFEDVLSEFAEAIYEQDEDFGSLIVKRYADEIRQMLDD